MARPTVLQWLQFATPFRGATQTLLIFTGKQLAYNAAFELNIAILTLALL